MTTPNTPDLYPHVEIINGHVKTNSLKIAEHFEKQHKDVLKSIKNLECSEEFAKRNFALSKYIVLAGKNSSREEIMYEITKDGFVFLVMGFTGKEAARWKEAYIQAFNNMETALRKQQRQEKPHRILSLRNQVVQLMRAVRREKVVSIQTILYQSLIEACRSANLPVPSLEELCAYSPLEDKWYKKVALYCQGRNQVTNKEILWHLGIHETQSIEYRIGQMLKQLGFEMQTTTDENREPIRVYRQVNRPH